MDRRPSLGRGAQDSFDAAGRLVEKDVPHRTTPGAQEHLLSVHLEPSHIDLPAKPFDSGSRGRVARIGGSQEGSIRGELLACGPCPRTRHHDTGGVGHHDGVEPPPLPSVCELVMKGDERVDAPLPSAFFQVHGAKCRKRGGGGASFGCPCPCAGGD